MRVPTEQVVVIDAPTYGKITVKRAGCVVELDVKTEYVGDPFFLYVNESKKLRKALKKAEKAVEHG